MNSGSGQKLSLEELKQLHQPTTAQTPVQEQVAPPETHPTKKEWMEMIEYLDTLWYHTDLQTNLLKKVSELLEQLPTRTQMDELLKAVKHLEQMSKQAGKPKENSFFSAQNQTSQTASATRQYSGIDFSADGGGSTASALVGLGHRLEQLQSAALVMPVQHHTDRKVLQKKNAKRRLPSVTRQMTTRTR